MSAVVRPHNLTLTDEVWDHLVEHHGNRGAAAALENAYRAANGLAPRPEVQQHGRFTSAAVLARAWAEAVLSGVDSGEPNVEATFDMEAALRKSGEHTPKGVGEEHWRAECRAALRARLNDRHTTPPRP